MKAEDSRAPIVKYGMATDETARIVDRHHAVMDEQHAIAGGVLDHNLRTACIAHALLAERPAPSEPVAAPPEVESPPEVAPPVVAITQRAKPDSLRERFGLS